MFSTVANLLLSPTCCGADRVDPCPAQVGQDEHKEPDVVVTYNGANAYLGPKLVRSTEA